MAEDRERKRERDRRYYHANKAAHRERVRRWAAKNPERVRAIQRLAQHGVEPTRPEPEACECCGRPADQTLCLDHDHVLQKFRGWLCRKCNAAIGQLGDTIDGLEKALAYLRRVQ